MFLGFVHEFCLACWGGEYYLTSVYLLRAVQYTDGKVFFSHIPTVHTKNISSIHK
jgi:hypothetical protein